LFVAVIIVRQSERERERERERRAIVEKTDGEKRQVLKSPF
jgi:hypothetical protein